MKKGVLVGVGLGILVLAILLVVFGGGFFGTGNPIKATEKVGASSASLANDTLCEQYYLHGFTNSSKLWIGNPIDWAKSFITHAELSNLLKDGFFNYTNSSSGENLAINSVQLIRVGNNTIQNTTYYNGPNYPEVLIKMSTLPSKPLYKYTLNFNRAVDFTDVNVTWKVLNLLGGEYTVIPGATSSKLYLLRSAQQLSLSIGLSYPSSSTVTIEGKTYTIELIGATDTSATIKVTNSAGNSSTKEITEGTSKKIQGLEVVVDDASYSEAYNWEVAKISVGSNKLRLTNGAEIRQGSDEVVIDGTLVNVIGNWWSSTTSFSISFFASDSDNDEILVGETHINPAFENLKLVFESYDNTNGAIIKIGGCQISQTLPTCSDSDGGLNYYVKGMTSDSLGNFGLDYCPTDKRITEYTCSSGFIKSNARYYCTYGCLNGACKKQQVPTCKIWNKIFGGNCVPVPPPSDVIS